MISLQPQQCSASADSINTHNSNTIANPNTPASIITCLHTGRVCGNCGILERKDDDNKHRLAYHKTGQLQCNACYWFSKRHTGQPRPDILIQRRRHGNQQRGRSRSPKTGKKAAKKNGSSPKPHASFQSIHLYVSPREPEGMTDSYSDDSLEGKDDMMAVMALVHMQAHL